ncbi:Autophagy-related protein 17 [Termitomyces sp. T112]|nr:Autophagy-related protein 17 [Termitomyces sp. T112]
MSSSLDHSHLVSLVLQSKQALQNGEQLCSRAHVVSNASANISVNVVALDAKVRWVTEAVGEQLKLVASVAKTIEEKRAVMGKRVQEWDKQRAKQSDALDEVLESLGSQYVPPDFYRTTSADSSIFGSQHSDDGHGQLQGGQKPHGSTLSTVSQSPSSTLKGGLRNGKQVAKEDRRPEREADKKMWKTLRDFVDDQAIEDVLDLIENDRLGLDYIMSKTDEYPETLVHTIEIIRESLPALPDQPPIKYTEELLAEQDTRITTMASHLESLASHYEQISNALQEKEAGEEFNDEDIDAMNRDTNELPSIMVEIDECADAIEECHDKLVAAKETYQTHLSLLAHTLEDLDELGEIMPEMLQIQEDVEAKCEEELNGLQNHLLTIEHLRDRFISYQTAFNKLILELARRRQYREAVENIVRGMMSQLVAMTEEEIQVRSHFNSEYGAHLPEDICLCVGNTPTRWEVVPMSGDVSTEFLPIIDDELITRAKDQIYAELEKATGLGPESL